MVWPAGKCGKGGCPREHREYEKGRHCGDIGISAYNCCEAKLRFFHGVNCGGPYRLAASAESESFIINPAYVRSPSLTPDLRAGALRL